MKIRDVLILLLIVVAISHFFGVPWFWGGPIGLILLVLLILVLLGKL